RARESRTPPVICWNGPPLGAARSALWARRREPIRLAPVQTDRLQLRPLAEEDVDAMAELDALPEIRAAIDPFAEHLPAEPAALRAYERRLVGHPGFLVAVERQSGTLVGWFQFEEHDGR